MYEGIVRTKETTGKNTKASKITGHLQDSACPRLRNMQVSATGRKRSSPVSGRFPCRYGFFNSPRAHFSTGFGLGLYQWGESSQV
jgi:hypothetical protein